MEVSKELPAHFYFLKNVFGQQQKKKKGLDQYERTEGSTWVGDLGVGMGAHPARKERGSRSQPTRAHTRLVSIPDKFIFKP